MVSWGAVSLLVVVLVGIAFGVLGMNPAQYVIAQVCLVVSAVVLAARVGWWLAIEQRDASVFHRSILSLLILGFVGVLCVEVVSWTQRLKSRQPPQSAGTLSSRTILSTVAGIVPTIEIGTSGVIFTRSVPGGPPRSEFEIGKIFMGAGQYAFESLTPILSDCELKVETVNSETKVSMVLLDAGANVIAKLVRNDWDWGGRPVSFDRNYNKDSIEVQDNSGHIVLQLAVLQDRVRLQLVCFRKNGNRAYMIQFKQHPTGARDALVSFNNTAKDDLAEVIKPLFRYPSSLHFGELNNE
jgi:hypothetical protein